MTSCRALAVVVALLWPLAAAAASADTPGFELVEVTSADPVVEAYPVVLLPAASAPHGQSKVLRESSVRRQGDGQWLIAVRLAPQDYADGALLSVSVRTSNGAVIPGEVRRLHDPPQRLAVPARCADAEHPDASLARLNEGALRTVLDVRNSKVELLQKMVHDALTPERVARLHAIERELNLSYAKPISANMPLEDLAYRLSAIEALR